MSQSEAILSPQERQTLLDLARGSIRHALAGAPRELPPPAEYAALHRPGAAFVTLYRRGALRGCMGTTSWEQPLHSAVCRVARAAAFDDPRFPPVQIGEIAEIAIGISRLTPLRLSRVDEIDLGVHGVCLERHSARALFLPKVAKRQGWDIPTLLRRLCEKAQLAADAWHDPATRLFLFEAEVFGDPGAD
jgi:AmmeMemoRadiSam system protein A